MIAQIEFVPTSALSGQFIYEYAKSKNSRGFDPIFYPLNWRRTLILNF